MTRLLGGECRGDSHWNKTAMLQGFKSGPVKYSACKGMHIGERHVWLPKHVRSIAFMFVLMGFFFLLDSLMVSIFHSMNLHNSSTSGKSSGIEEDTGTAYEDKQESQVQMYDRLLNLASNALAEKAFKQDSSNFWEEPYRQASVWKPCADRKSPTNPGKSDKNNGFILVSANGGLNQQRVAICNAVVVASLLNATLVLPKFLYSNVWNDPSQFGDIYQEGHFMNILKDEVYIVKELPSHLKSVDMEAIGSLITDADITKEAKPIEYVKKVLPLLLQNGVVHFLGFGNRLGFDPLPFKLQRLRCKCNFHALKFVPKIQQVGSLLIRRIRNY
ncbi:hypothetical protein L1049_009676 [Liquidambar formosana]|uniref:O-fucosyltransferase family protein n=1 Tax=Liquidambar formosana TaxID=63359 RepID=A0AAP0R3P1_LIQFO